MSYFYLLHCVALVQTLAFIVTDGIVAAVCGVVTAIVMQVSLVVMFVLKSRADAQERAADKEERKELALLTKVGLDATVAGIAANMEEGGRREERLGRKVQALEHKADAAYVAGNGSQEKFVAVVQRLEEHSKVLSGVPAKVEIVNGEDNPVHTVVE